MDRSRERRCVSKVQRIEILNLSTHGNAGDSNVNHLVHCTCTQNLNAQQLMGCLVSNQLGHKGGSVGIVMCLIVSNTGNGDHIVACFFSLCLGQTGTACVQTFSQLHNAGAQAAAVGNSFAGQVLGQQTAGDIGGRAHGGPLTLTGQTVEYLSAVANSVNIVQIGALELIHHNGATVQLNAGVGKPCGSGTDANCQNNSFAVEVANGGADTGCLVAAQNLGEACAGDNTDALCLQLLTDVVGHLSVEQVGHNLRSHVNYSNLQTLGQQVLCNLQTNEAAADNNCVAALVLVHISAQADGVIRSTHGEYAGKVRTGHIGNKGGSAGSDDQLVVGNDFAVCESNGLGSSVNAHSFHLGLDLNAGEAGVLCRGVDDQLVTAFDAAANIVGQAAASIGNILALGVNGDFRAAILTHQLGSGLGTGGDTADYNNVHISNSFLLFFRFSATVQYLANIACEQEAEGIGSNGNAQPGDAAQCDGLQTLGEDILKLDFEADACQSCCKQILCQLAQNAGSGSGEEAKSVQTGHNHKPQDKHGEGLLDNSQRAVVCVSFAILLCAGCHDQSPCQSNKDQHGGTNQLDIQGTVEISIANDTLPGCLCTCNRRCVIDSSTGDECELIVGQIQQLADVGVGECGDGIKQEDCSHSESNFLFLCLDDTAQGCDRSTTADAGTAANQDGSILRYLQNLAADHQCNGEGQQDVENDQGQCTDTGTQNCCKIQSRAGCNDAPVQELLGAVGGACLEFLGNAGQHIADNHSYQQRQHGAANNGSSEPGLLQGSGLVCQYTDHDAQDNCQRLTPLDGVLVFAHGFTSVVSIFLLQKSTVSCFLYRFLLDYSIAFVIKST